MGHEAEGIWARLKGKFSPQSGDLPLACCFSAPRVKVSANAGQLRLIVLVMRIPEN